MCRHDRTQGDFHQWIHFDLLYVQHLSFLVDLKILAATAVTLGGHWPAPLAWILSSRHRDASVQAPIALSAHSVAAGAGPASRPAGLLDGEPI